MDIRPVDVQMFINKSSQINKNESQEQRGNEQAQLFSDHFQKNNIKQQQIATETSKAEDSQINKDAKGHGQKKNKKNSKEKQDKKNDKNKQKLGLFDISI